MTGKRRRRSGAWWALALGVVLVGVCSGSVALGASSAGSPSPPPFLGDANSASSSGKAAPTVGGTTTAAPVLAGGFQDVSVLTGLSFPTAVRFASDGRIFVAQKSGVVKVFHSLSDTSPVTVVDLSGQVDNYWDRGLLGMALDPNFPTSPYVYLLYTYDAPPGQTAPVWNDACPTPPGPTTDGCVVTGKLVRITLSGDTISGSPQTLISGEWCQQYPSHSIGDLHFGADGKLYVSGGDGASFNFADFGQGGGSLSGTPTPANPCGDPPVPVGTTQTAPTAEGGALRSESPRRAAGEPVLLNGAILRVDPATGNGLPDNPMASSTDANAKRIVAYGLRNPFRFAIRPGTNDLWIGDVGWSTWEEIDRQPSPTTAALNFGWPCYEGAGAQSGYQSAGLNLCTSLYSAGTATAPYYTYNHADSVVTGDGCPTANGSSISGMSFYQSGSYPSSYNGALFFADYTRKCIWAMLPGGNGLPSTSNLQAIESNAGGPVGIEAGPNGDLFYAGYDDGSIHRILYTGQQQNPDLALLRPATSSSFETASLTADKANDGNSTTRWSSDPIDNQWWQVDLGSVQAVTSVQLNWETAYASTYKIQGSTDGTTFTDIATVNISSSGWKTTSFPTANIRYVRVLGVTRATIYGISFWDAQVYGSGSAVPVNSALPTISGVVGQGQTLTSTTGSWSNSPTGYSYQWQRCDSSGANCQNISGATTNTYLLTGTDVGQTVRVAVTATNGAGSSQPAYSSATSVVRADKALNKTATSSSNENTSLTPNLANDGNSATRWSSSFADNQWWQVDLGTSQQVDTVALNWETAYASTYKIQASTDGTTFTDAATVNISSSGWKTTSFTAVSARYLRVLGVTRATIYGISFWDAQVFGPTAPANNPPTAFIDTPSASLTWAVGDTINFSGHATDPEQVTLPASALTWTEIIHHCTTPSTCHTHIVQTFTGVASGSLNAPDHDYPSWLELQLTATDAGGLTNTASIHLDPKTVDLTLASNPTGLTLTANSVTQAAPFVKTVIVNSQTSISAPTSQTLNGTTYQFVSWSDGGAATHNITAPATATTYTATYQAQTPTVTLSFATNPTGLSLTVNGTSGTAPFTRTVNQGSTVTLTAPTTQTLNGTTYQFVSWSDGGAASHSITAPTTATTYTATYTAAPTAPVNTALPNVSGPPKKGRTLTTSNGSWTGTAPITFTYQWLRCDSAGANCVAIAGATAQTYTSTASDVGFRIRARVIATNSVGSAQADSAPTSAIK